MLKIDGIRPTGLAAILFALLTILYAVTGLELVQVLAVLAMLLVLLCVLLDMSEHARRR